MFSVSSKLDYSLRALAHLARAGAGPITANRIAAAEGIPVRFLGAALSDLRRAGLLESRRGGSGGFTLARPADAVTVADVVRAVDGTLVDRPSLAGAGSLVGLWQELEERLEEELGSVTIADLAGVGDDAP